MGWKDRRETGKLSLSTSAKDLGYVDRVRPSWTTLATIFTENAQKKAGYGQESPSEGVVFGGFMRDKNCLMRDKSAAKYLIRLETTKPQSFD
nr:hypothetical protein [Enterovibrio nigricans]